jgi:hypothetical protein
VARPRANKAVKVTEGYGEDDATFFAERLHDKALSMETFLRVQHRDKRGTTIPLTLNPAQLGLHELIDRIKAFNVKRTTILNREDPSVEITEDPVRVVVGKCRRGGISTYVEAYAFDEANKRRDFNVLVVANRGDNAENIFKYSSDFYNKWPTEHLRFRQEANPPSQKGITWPQTGSRFIVQTAGGAGVSKGFQFDFYHFSECAFYADYSEVSDAISAAPAYAWVFEESTANGPAGGFYERWQGALDIETLEQALDAQDWEVFDKWNGFLSRLSMTTNAA